MSPAPAPTTSSPKTENNIADKSPSLGRGVAATPPNSKIANALTEVIKACAGKPLVKRERNAFAKYNYVGIDAVLEYIAPIAAEHGLSWSWYEESAEITTIGHTDVIAFTYVFTMRHKSGEVWLDHVRMTIFHPLQGAQTAGSAASYAEKLYCRQMFKLQYGEQDADAVAPDFGAATKPAVAEPLIDLSSDDFPAAAEKAAVASDSLSAYTKYAKEYIKQQATVMADLDADYVYVGLKSWLAKGRKLCRSDRDKMILYGATKPLTEELDRRGYDYKEKLKTELGAQ